jgi:prevent-host-death family protein
MKVAPMADVRNRFSAFLEQSKAGPIFITRNGRIAAVLEAMTDDEVEDFLLERSPRFRRMLEAAALRRGGISLEAYRRMRPI